MAPVLRPCQLDVFPPHGLSSVERAVSELFEIFGSPLPSLVDEPDDDYVPPQRVLKRTRSGERKVNCKLSFDVKTPEPSQIQQTPSADGSASGLSDAVDACHESPLARKGNTTLTEPEQLRNRNARAANEIDVLEGLPIRQWRQVESHIGPPHGQLPLAGKSIWPELPMPRDSHMLPEVSQQLLCAARAGRIYKAPTPPREDEEKENAGEDDEAKDENRGFVVRKWSQVPRHLEEPEAEYLAKRRKGLPSTRSGLQGSTAQTSTMRKTMVKRYDAEGNAHIYEVLAPEGQKIEGEITNDDEDVKAVAPEPAVAPGTVVEGVGVVNSEGVVVAHDLLQFTPNRRKHPPPRKKHKKGGPGRGKKGPLSLRQSLEGTEGGADTPTSAALLGVPGANASDEATSAAASTQGDTPMPDAADGEVDSSEEGEEGDEDGGSEEGELAPSPEADREPTPSLTAAPTTQTPLIKAEEITFETLAPLPHLAPPEIAINREASSSPELPLASAISNRSGSLTQPLSVVSIPAVSEEQLSSEVHFDGSDVDLFGSLERHLDNEDKP